MQTRRDFIKASLTSTAAAAVFGPVLGANERVRVGLIGCGSRGSMLGAFIQRHPDCALVAACDVAKGRLDEAVAKLGGGAGPIDAYADYRRILERNDVDAVIVATPDHWHGPMTVEACAAGKDVYVEKPVSNRIEDAVRMVEAARTHRRVVQVGLQQRAGEHFQEAARILQSGTLDPITHVVLQYRGGYTVPPEPATDPPPDLDWDMFQGPAERRPYTPGRQRRWRAYYDYGGGLVTDWGVHLTDVALWYLNADAKAPRLTSASAQYVAVANPDRDQVPDAFVVSWQYDGFVMSVTNAVLPTEGVPIHGNQFFGPRGCLLVHRNGFDLRPIPPRRGPNAPEPPPPLEPVSRRHDENYQNDPSTVAHLRNFLDCIKSRERPATDIEIGFNSTLPCLLAILAIREGRSFTWDGAAARPA